MNDSCRLDMDTLEKVSGGAAAPADESAEKLKELKEALKELAPDYTGHRILALADKWEKNGYQPSAREFVAQELGIDSANIRTQ